VPRLSLAAERQCTRHKNRVPGDPEHSVPGLKCALARRQCLQDPGEVNTENKWVGRLRREIVDQFVVERVHPRISHAD
jgi:hypothetical protein